METSSSYAGFESSLTPLTKLDVDDGEEELDELASSDDDAAPDHAGEFGE